MRPGPCRQAKDEPTLIDMDAVSLQDVSEASVPLIETTGDGQTTTTMIWVVVVDGKIYIRSYRGDQGKWYQRALANPDVALIVEDRRLELTAKPAVDEGSVEAVSREFLRKYESSPYRDAMVADEVLDTTLVLVPR